MGLIICKRIRWKKEGSLEAYWLAKERWKPCTCLERECAHDPIKKPIRFQHKGWLIPEPTSWVPLSWFAFPQRLFFELSNFLECIIRDLVWNTRMLLEYYLDSRFWNLNACQFWESSGNCSMRVSLKNTPPRSYSEYRFSLSTACIQKSKIYAGICNLYSPFRLCNLPCL